MYRYPAVHQVDINHDKPVKYYLDLKAKHGVKSIRALKELGIVRPNEIRTGSDNEINISKSIKYDDDGYCSYVEGNISTRDVHTSYSGRIYRLSDIHDIMLRKEIKIKGNEYDGNMLPIDKKIKILNSIFDNQPNMRVSLFSEGSVGKINRVVHDELRIEKTVNILVKSGSPILVNYILNLVNVSRKSDIIEDRIRELLKGRKIKYYDVYTILRKYSDEIEYESGKYELAYMNNIPPEDITFDESRYLYLFSNPNTEIVKYFCDKLGEESVKIILEGVSHICDGAYRVIAHLLPADYYFNGLYNISNIFHRLQILEYLEPYGASTSRVDHSIRRLSEYDTDPNNRRLYEITNRIPNDIRNFIFGEYRSSDELPLKSHIQSFSRNELAMYDAIVACSINSYLYIRYKVYKYCIKTEININTLDRLFEYIKKTDDYWLAEMIFDKHYCIQSTNMLKHICGSNKLYESIGHYIIPDLVQIHECRNTNCPFKARLISRTKSARN